MYAASGDYKEMIEAIQDSIAVDAQMVSYLKKPVHLAMLATACQSHGFGQVNALLGCSLPVHPSEVVACIDALKPDSKMADFGARVGTNWCVLGKSDACDASDLTLFPTMLSLGLIENEEYLPNGRRRAYLLSWDPGGLKG